MRDTVIRIKPGEDFVITPCIENICRRGLAYLEAGYPLHLTGMAGAGKTTLALHLAGLMGSTVRVTLEIEAEIPSGAPDNVVRTVTENSRTLKFTSQGFEKE